MNQHEPARLGAAAGMGGGGGSVSKKNGRCPLRFRESDACQGSLTFKNFPPRYVCDACARVFSVKDARQFSGVAS